MIAWKNIEIVLLDMDGTLLDLNFDNYFWLEFVPQRFAEKNQLSLAQAKQQLIPQFKKNGRYSGVVLSGLLER
jgi:hypothetical protein